MLYLVGEAEASRYAACLSRTEHDAGWMRTHVLSLREHFGILFGDRIFYLSQINNSVLRIIQQGEIYRNTKELFALVVKTLCMFLCASSWLYLL